MCNGACSLSSTTWRRGDCLFYFFQFAYVQWCMLPLLHNVEERAGERRQNIPKSPNTFCNCCLLSLTLSSTLWRRGNCLFYFFQFAYVQWCMLPLLHNVEERGLSILFFPICIYAMVHAPSPPQRGGEGWGEEAKYTEITEHLLQLLPPLPNPLLHAVEERELSILFFPICICAMVHAPSPPQRGGEGWGEEAKYTEITEHLLQLLPPLPNPLLHNVEERELTVLFFSICICAMVHAPSPPQRGGEGWGEEAKYTEITEHLLQLLPPLPNPLLHNVEERELTILFFPICICSIVHATSPPQRGRYGY